MASLSGWTEAGLGGVLVMLLLGIIMVNMNSLYNQNYDSTFGIASNSTLQSFQDYQGTLETGLEGEAESNALYGINLLTSWSIIKTGIKIVIDFVTGQWVQNAVGLLNLGDSGVVLGIILRLLFVFSLGFIVLKILFKVKP
jgi:hypothetical protein